MDKVFIKNRKGQKISILVETAEPQMGLAFVMHGLGGFKEQPHIQVMAEALIENGYTVVRFDATNSMGESDGKYEEATITNYYEDLENVISWAKDQSWYQEPFILAGHSLGGICTALFAEKYSEKVKALAPIATAVSGQLMKESYASYGEDFITNWKIKGYFESPSVSKPGLIKRTGWLFLEDSLQYDLLCQVGNLTMPVLLIVGDSDTSTPVEHQQILFEALPGPKEMFAIKGSGHNFRKIEHLTELKELFSNWIKKITL